MSDIPDGYYDRELMGYREAPHVVYYDQLGAPKYPDKVKRQCRASGDRTRRQVRTLLARDGDRCHYCDIVMSASGQGVTVIETTMTREHIVPRVQGGSNSLYNLVLACSKCNNERGQGPSPCDCTFCKTAYAIFEEER